MLPAGTGFGAPDEPEFGLLGEKFRLRRYLGNICLPFAMSYNSLINIRAQQGQCLLTVVEFPQTERKIARCFYAAE